jgi:hypothetical protein
LEAVAGRWSLLQTPWQIRYSSLTSADRDTGWTGLQDIHDEQDSLGAVSK